MPADGTVQPQVDIQNRTSLLDDVNIRLLQLLATDPRLSTSGPALQVATSVPAVRERIGRLERAGIIRGYRLDIANAAIGLPAAAWVRIRPGPGQLPAPRQTRGPARAMFAWIAYDNRNRLHLSLAHQTAHAELAAVRDRKGGALRVGAFRGVGATIVAPLRKRLARSAHRADPDHLR